MLLGFYIFILIIVFACFIFFVGSSQAALKSSPKIKFYDFNEQLVDGQISRPAALYTDARQKIKFDRLLRLKKSFLKDLFSTAKEKVFK
jgi:hypothetical protein